MKIHIHRGQNQIGGSIIEISTEATKIIFDVGINLDEDTTINVPEIKGLFYGVKEYDAVFISHYHSDHFGLLDYIVPDIPIYIGERAYKIISAAQSYREIKSEFSPSFLYDRIPICIGNIKITPIECDHSAFDSYMFLIEADNKTILYTGDFRGNGRKDYNNLIEILPKVDAVIIEGTTLSREDTITNIEEEFLEDIAIKELKKHTGPAFVMMSAMNIDRLITCYNAAKNTDRIFLEDLYTAGIACAASKNIPNPIEFADVKVFMTDGNSKRHEDLNKYGDAKISKYSIAKQRYLMCIRQSMKNYLEKLNKLQSFEDGVLFYGMWKGYQEQKDMQEFLEFMKSKGVKIHTLHTSGHADVNTIECLIDKIKPQIIIPVHTENSSWFNRYKDEMKVIFNESIIEV